MRQRGVLAMLARLNSGGLAALSGYANGGLVSRLSMPAIRAGVGGSALQPVNLHVGGNRYAMSASPDVVSQLKGALAREALRKG